MFASHYPSDYYGDYGSSYCGWYPGRVAHGRITLAETSPPQSWTEPLAVAEAATHLRIPVTDEETARLPVFIAAARSVAEGVYHRILARRQFQYAAHYWEPWRIELGMPPLVSVDRVQFTDSDSTVTALSETTGYVIDRDHEPGAIRPPNFGSWPTFNPAPGSNVLALFTAGYAPDSAFWADSAHIKIGMLYLITEWFTNRLPFTMGQDELPAFGATYLLSHGARRIVK